MFYICTLLLLSSLTQLIYFIHFDLHSFCNYILSYLCFSIMEGTNKYLDFFTDVCVLYYHVCYYTFFYNCINIVVTNMFCVRALLKR